MESGYEVTVVAAVAERPNRWWAGRGRVQHSHPVVDLRGAVESPRARAAIHGWSALQTEQG
eukprot:1835017-Prymnesium_polylepis.1